MSIFTDTLKHELYIMFTRHRVLMDKYIAEGMAYDEARLRAYNETEFPR